MERTYNNTHNITFINMEKFVYTWTVINFRDTIKKMTSSRIESPWFEINGIKKELRIDLSINSDSDLQLSFYHKAPTYPGSMRYVVSLIDKNGRKQFKHSSISKNSDGSRYTRPIFSKFVEKKFLDENNDLLPNGNLIIHCTFYYNEKIFNMESPIKIFDEEKNLIQQEESDYFKQLFETGKFSDVKLIVNDKVVFNVHKNILAMHSAVFSAMLERRMKNRQENLVPIYNINSDVMKEVLRYIYTKKIENFSTLGKDILIAADKYAIEGLKYLCEQKFISELSIEKIPEMLNLIDRCKCNNLKKIVSEFLQITAIDVTKELFEKSSSNSAILEIVKAPFLKQ